MLFWTTLRFALGIALLAYLAHSRLIDFRTLARLVTAWPTTLAAFALILLDLALMSIRLTWLFRPQGLRLPFRASFELTLVSGFFATFLPGAAGGDLAKLFYAARDNAGRRTEIFAIIIFDRVVGLFSLLLLPLLFAPLFTDLIRNVAPLRILLALAAALAVAIAIVFWLCLSRQTFLERAITWLSRFAPRTQIPERAFAVIARYREYPATIFAAVIASLAANAILIAATALALHLVAPESLSVKLCLVVPMGDVANSLPFTPGGLGVGEASFDSLFRLAGLHGGAEALLCWRIWRAIVGLLGLALYLRGIRRSVFS